MSYLLTPAQIAIAEDRHRFRVANLGRRTGKTVLAVLEMVAKAVAKDGRRVAYLAPTFIQARDIAWLELKRVAQPVIISANEGRLELTIKTADKGTALIVLKGWESVESLRGQSFDFIVIDEVAMMREFWVGWYEVVRPTLTDRTGEVLFCSTPRGFNHFYDLYNKEGGDSDFKSFHFTTYDNPHVPSVEVDKARAELPPDQFAQEYLADFKKQTGLVYKEFDRFKHVISELPNNFRETIAQTIAGLDSGFTNPTAYLTIKRDMQNRYWVTEEWYKTGQTEGQVVEYVASNKPDICYCDPAAAALIEALKRAGVNMRDVNKGADSVINGIAKIRELLTTNRLFIHSSCINLIQEFETYAYPEKRPDNNEPEIPIKEHDHALDALSYAVRANAPTNVQTKQQAVPKPHYGKRYLPPTPQIG